MNSYNKNSNLFFLIHINKKAQRGLLAVFRLKYKVGMFISNKLFR